MAKTWRFRLVLLRALKFFGIAIAIVFLLFGVASWMVFEKKNDWLLDQIQSNVKQAQSGELEITTIDLRLFKHFPDITIELDGITYYEHRDSLRTPQEKPILQAEQLFIALEFLPLINEELKILEISLSKAQVNIIQYKNGQLNIRRALAPPVKAQPVATPKKTAPKPATVEPAPKEKRVTPVTPPAPAKNILQVNLEHILLNEVLVSWKSNVTREPDVIRLEELEIDIVRKDSAVTATLFSEGQIQSLYLGHSALPAGKIKLNAHLGYEPRHQTVTLHSGELAYDEFSARLEGTYAHAKNQLLDLDIDASANDLELLALIIKPEVLKRNPDILKKGDIYVKGKVFGELESQSPQIDMSFGMRDLALQLPPQMGMFNKVGFEGRFTSGALPDYSQATFEIRNLSGKLPGGYLEGAFRVHNFKEPYLKYQLDAELKLDGYDQVFKMDVIQQLEGSISLKANFEGPVKHFAEHQMDSNRSSSVAFKDLSFILNKTRQKVSVLSGKIENKNNLATIDQLAFTYGKNDVLLNATVVNLMYFLLDHKNDIVAAGHLQSDQFYTRDFIFDTTSTAQVQDRISNFSFDFDIKTTTSKDSNARAIPTIAFDIRKLSAQLDKLPDIKWVDTKGTFGPTENGLKLDLHEFHATMPNGRLDVAGDLLIRKKLLWEFNARVKANKFPWTYIEELAAEINSDKVPTKKNLPVANMDIVTANLDLSAAITTYPFDINKVTIRNSGVNFQAAGSKPLSVEKLNLALEHLRFIHPHNSGSLTGLKSTKGTIEMKQLGVPGLKKFDINMTATGKEDQLDIEFSSATQKAKSERGKLSLNISGKEPHYHLHFAVQGASLEYYIKRFYKKKLMEGNIDYMLDIRATGASWEVAKQTLAGEIVISGDSLRLYGVDIDKVLKRYEKSQNFNLTDLGAVLIAGPIGLAVTKGTNFVSLAAIHLDSSQQTRIKTLVTKWKLEDQQLITQDVAFATTQNRIAFDGRIDFARDSIPGIVIAVVDKEGCSLMDQKLHGKMNALKTGKLNITKTLFGSVTNFVNAVVGKDCKPVYTGSVKPPL